MAPIGSRPAISGRTFGLRRRRCARTSGRTSSQTVRRPRRSRQRLRGSTIAPPPGAITRVSVGPDVGSAERLDGRALAAPEAGLALAFEELGDAHAGRPLDLLVEVDEHRGTTSGNALADRGLATPGGPTTTSSTLSRLRRCRRRRERRSPVPRRRRPRAARRAAPAIGPSESLHLGHRVAAGLLEHELGEGQQHHRLADDARRRHDADVAALVVRLLDGRAGQEVRGGQGTGEGRDRLDRAADDDRLAVRDAGRQAAGVVRAMDPATRLAAALDHVVDLRAEPARLLEPEPELDALDDVDAHDRRGERRVQPPIPVDVRPEPDRDARRDDLEHATDGVTRFARRVDAGDHRAPPPRDPGSAGATRPPPRGSGSPWPDPPPRPRPRP